MLPFLMEQNKYPSESQSDTAGDKAAAENAGRTEEQKYITVADQRRSARKSTIMLVILFAVGLLCLWMMIKKSTPSTTSATTLSKEEAEIEAAITRLTGVSSEMSNLDDIVKKFYEFSDVQQIKIGELVKNPFKTERAFGGLKTLAAISSAEQSFELVTICQTDRGYCCMIDDKILYEGDSIRGFMVRQIGNNFVKLEQNDNQTILKLSE